MKLVVPNYLLSCFKSGWPVNTTARKELYDQM